MNPSFGFSLSGSRSEAIKQMAGVSTEDRPAHADMVRKTIEDLLINLPDKCSVTITVNTYLEK